MWQGQRVSAFDRTSSHAIKRRMVSRKIYSVSRKFALPGEEELEGAEQNSPSSCFSSGGVRAFSVLHPLLFQSVQMHLRVPIKAKAGVTKRVRHVSVLAFRVTRVDDLVDYRTVSS